MVGEDSLHPVVKALFSLCLMLVGISIWHLYLGWIRIYGVAIMPIWFMWIGVVICSISITALYKMNEKFEGMTPYLLFGIYLLSLSSLMMFTSRFNAINGSDIIGEYLIAKEALSRGRWPLELVNVNKYATCLSVTVFPAILSEVSGLGIETTFRFLFPILEAFVPICLFMTVRCIFSTKIASLSAILYAVSYWYFALSFLARHQIASIFLLLMSWSIFHKQSPKLRFLSLIFQFGIIYSHYTVASLLVIVFLAFLVTPVFIRLIKDIGTQVNRDSKGFMAGLISAEFLSCYVVLLLVWLVYVTYAIFLTQVSFGREIILSLMGLWKEEPHVMTEWLIKGSPRGPITTAWFDFQSGLIALGSLYTVFKFINNIKKSTWNLGGCAIMVYIATSLLVPVMTRYLPLDRLIGFGYIFFATYQAVLLLRTEKSSRLKYIVVIVLLISPAMNMRLPENERSLLYHPESSMSQREVALEIPLYTWHYKSAEWISRHVPLIEKISGGEGVLEAAWIASRLGSMVDYPTFENNKYLLIPQYYIAHKIWIRERREGEHVDTPTKNITVSQLYENNIIFDNGHFALLRQI